MHTHDQKQVRENEYTNKPFRSRAIISHVQWQLMVHSPREWCKENIALYKRNNRRKKHISVRFALFCEPRFRSRLFCSHRESLRIARFLSISFCIPFPILLFLSPSVNRSIAFNLVKFARKLARTSASRCISHCKWLWPMRPFSLIVSLIRHRV